MVGSRSGAGPDDASTRDPYELTLAAAERQQQTVTGEGRPVAPLLDGVRRNSVATHVDERGFLVELFDPRWEWLDEPFAYAYVTTVRPGYAKGWGLHKEHTDRYFLLFGHLEVVLYDVRRESTTYGKISVVRLSEYDRGHLTIPAFVWHALRNVGDTDVVVINFPTIQFDHAHPDKYGLPLHNDVIPYSIGDTPGW
jgi:dTDP-4-dehydrorhamnose 3,5-epimerase